MTQPQNVTLTLKQLHEFRRQLPSNQRAEYDQLIIPHDDTECGRLLQLLEEKTGSHFDQIGPFCVYIQDVLGCRIQGSDSRGIWWQLPPEPNDEEQTT